MARVPAIDLASIVDAHAPSLLDRVMLAAMLAEGVARSLPAGSARERALTAVAALHDLTRALGARWVDDHDHEGDDAP